MKQYYLITGASGRLGAYMALYFAKQGRNLILHYNSAGGAVENTINEIREISSVDVQKIQKDLSCTGANLLNEALKYGDIELIVHCASSIFEDNLGGDFAIENLQNSLNIHAISLVEMGAEIKKSGILCDIIAISDANMQYETKYFSYSLGKKMLNEAVKYLAFHLKDLARVNAISPIWIEDFDFALPCKAQNILKILGDKKLTQNFCTGLEICKTVDYLREIRSITGQIMVLDAGVGL